MKIILTSENGSVEVTLAMSRPASSAKLFYSLVSGTSIIDFEHYKNIFVPVKVKRFEF